MKNEAAVALGKKSAESNPHLHSKEYMTDLSRRGVEARKKKQEDQSVSE